MGKDNATMWQRVSFFAAGLLVLFTLGTAQAAPLGLILLSAPDITSTFVDLNYNPGTQTLTTTSGIASSVVETVGGPSFNIDVDGSFILTAKIDSSGALIADPMNTLTIAGTILGSPPVPGTGTLIAGNLTAFGFDSGLLEFSFNVTGGALASLYGGLGGVIVSGTFTPNFITGFSTGVTGSADAAAAVPEPATLLLLATGLFGVAGIRTVLRQRSKS